ncbi:MAG: superoxide dismutase, Ni [Dehalococcoidia bacterium]|nr:superoxide dismutase, Ni [Dehalococcoidia bacterium]
MNFVSPVLRLFDRVAPPETVSAHCDIPCGIYDPHAAQIAALTVLRMDQLIEGLTTEGAARENSFVRYVKVKEEHGEIVKRELNILWHDYFRPEHLEKYSDLHTTFWNANKLASRNKQNVDVAAATELLTATNRIAEIFWETKGVATRKAGSNQAVGGELVYVDNK